MKNNIERMLNEYRSLTEQLKSMISDQELIFKNGDEVSDKKKECIRNLIRRIKILEEKLMRELKGNG